MRRVLLMLLVCAGMVGCHGAFLYIPRHVLEQPGSQVVLQMSNGAASQPSTPTTANALATPSTPGLIQSATTSIATTPNAVVTVSTDGNGVPKPPSAPLLGANETACTYIDPPSSGPMPATPNIPMALRENHDAVENILVDYILTLRKYIGENKKATDTFYSTYQDHCRSKAAAAHTP